MAADRALVDYLRAARAAGEPLPQVRAALAGVGWPPDVVEQAIAEVAQASASPSAPAHARHVPARLLLIAAVALSAIAALGLFVIASSLSHAQFRPAGAGAQQPAAAAPEPAQPAAEAPLEPIPEPASAAAPAPCELREYLPSAIAYRVPESTLLGGGIFFNDSTFQDRSWYLLLGRKAREPFNPFARNASTNARFQVIARNGTVLWEERANIQFIAIIEPGGPISTSVIPLLIEPPYPLGAHRAAMSYENKTIFSIIIPSALLRSALNSLPAGSFSDNASKAALNATLDRFNACLAAGQDIQASRILEFDFLPLLNRSVAAVPMRYALEITKAEVMDLAIDAAARLDPALAKPIVAPPPANPGVKNISVEYQAVGARDLQLIPGEGIWFEKEQLQIEFLGANESNRTVCLPVSADVVDSPCSREHAVAFVWGRNGNTGQEDVVQLRQVLTVRAETYNWSQWRPQSINLVGYNVSGATYGSYNYSTFIGPYTLTLAVSGRSNATNASQPSVLLKRSVPLAFSITGLSCAADGSKITIRNDGSAAITLGGIGSDLAVLKHVNSGSAPKELRLRFDPPEGQQLAAGQSVTIIDELCNSRDHQGSNCEYKLAPEADLPQLAQIYC